MPPPSGIMSALPDPSHNRIAIHPFPRAERAIARGHPWLFEHGIRQQRRAGGPGDLAILFDRKDRFLAIGLYDPLSPIRVRVFQHRRPATIDREWFAARLRDAWKRRDHLLVRSTTGFRMVNGANDRLPGMVIDRYAGVLVMKLYSHAWIPHLSGVVDHLREMLAPETVVLRLSRRMQERPDHLYGLSDGDIVHGAPVRGPILFQENGLTFEADVLRGQKTGFFLDQRDNRSRVEDLSRGRSVLNVFAYSGSFSVYAARGGATDVVSVDVDRRVLEAARRNFMHNQNHPAVAAARHRVITDDAFIALRELYDAGRRFGIVILDPPAFAKARSDVERALRSYQTLIRRGMGVLAPGGTLVAASCSSRIDADTFVEVVTATARQIGRPLRILDLTGHAVDHPVTFAEGEYLTCVYATDGV